MREKGRIKRGFNNQSPITPYQQKQSRTNVRTTQIKESIQSEIHSKCFFLIAIEIFKEKMNDDNNDNDNNDNNNNNNNDNNNNNNNSDENNSNNSDNRREFSKDSPTK